MRRRWLWRLWMAEIELLMSDGMRDACGSRPSTWWLLAGSVKSVINRHLTDLGFLSINVPKSVEVGVAFYVFVRFWNSNNLTNLAIPVLITGMKIPERMLVVKQGIDKEDHNLVEAYYSYKRLKYLFANQIINENKYHNYSIISEKTAADAFNLVAIELALMYDVLYTKATVVYSLFGICLRCISFICFVSALVLFVTIIDKHSYPYPTSRTSELLDKYQYLTWQDVDITLHDTIFKYLKEKVNGLHQPRTFLQSFKKTLDELLSKSGEDNVHKGSKNLQISKQLSDYMLYLLLFRPSMLLKGIGEIRYEHTFLHTERYYEARPYKHKLRANKGMTSNIIPHSVFEQAENLASELKCDDADGLENTWEMISEVWLEMLTFAAQNCEWKEHAQHLRKGGELLTHVSVLMVNFGLSKQVVPNDNS
ncbi:hypothetical protein JRO89_XS09G0222600 [Xanthoceras sorbifolium]|uniref:DUF4220 domain-containing protein n=1 Tax=Xanthoceras sorbifolium TaxID=99658 RepID=A0ABQ8HMM7_9ROSI|nr:hypothetical protein JRO89_XS09G0222600 [Xanthoceras sorbifolium]